MAKYVAAATACGGAVLDVTQGPRTEDARNKTYATAGGPTTDTRRNVSSTEEADATPDKLGSKVHYPAFSACLGAGEKHGFT